MSARIQTQPAGPTYVRRQPEKTALYRVMQDHLLTADTPKGRQWADRALMRIRRKAEAIGVSLNAEKTRLRRVQ